VIARRELTYLTAVWVSMSVAHVPRNAFGMELIVEHVNVPVLQLGVMVGIHLLMYVLLNKKRRVAVQ
jgi:hypothetical protein